MNITLARTFLVTISAGNLNRAAERLNVTQSTVTTRLNALEDQLGQTLLLRSKDGTELTAAGFQFVRYAEMFIQIWQQARYEVGLPKGFSAVCNLGCQYDLWGGVGDAWLQRIRSAHPQFAVSVWSGVSDEIHRWLSGGMIDAAFVFEAQSNANCVIEPLFEDWLLQVSTEKRSYMRWDPHYVYVDLGPDFRRRHAEAYPVDETAIITFGSSDWALDHLMTNGGSGYLPWRRVAKRIADKQLFPVAGTPVFKRMVYIAHSQHRTGQWQWFEPFIREFKEEFSKCKPNIKMVNNYIS